MERRANLKSSTTDSRAMYISSRLSINTPLDKSTAIVHGDVHVRLDDVTPYPTAGRKPRPDEYRGTVSLHKG